MWGCLGAECVSENQYCKGSLTWEQFSLYSFFYHVFSDLFVLFCFYILSVEKVYLYVYFSYTGLMCYWLSALVLSF